MNFWNNDIVFVTRKIYMWIQKNDIIISKLKNSSTSDEVCKSKLHWNFPNLIKFDFKN